jgi:outer membrane protein OmpA-like peptidoglycan-associated protein
MKKAVFLSLVLLGIPLYAGGAEQKDATGCQDHPLFTRMPGYWIHSCAQKDFDSHAFGLGKGKTEKVEGRTFILRYYPQAGLNPKPSELQIQRNHENAVKKLGGTVLSAEKGRETLKLAKDGKEFWVDLWADLTGKYGLTIVEKSAMAQVIVANADLFSNDLKATGHAAVYGIFFDTGKSGIKPESEQAVGEIAKLLRGDTGLKLYVVGHTDAVGGVAANLKLSQDRAEAVLQALVGSHGIAAGRLTSFGNGPFAPVASNDTEEGRAKNRRVELVKQ